MSNQTVHEKVFDSNHSPICVEGARVHNLKNICLALPWNRITVITGPSGSGKSSLAFDTIYAEGQRQYIESLSVYSRQFLHQLERPDVDAIRGLQPTISIDQRGTIQNPRSTVATLTEIYDYLRLLYSRIGVAHCYKCGRPIRQQTPEQMLEEILHLPANIRMMLLTPIVREKKGAHKDALRRIVKSGFVRARIDDVFVELDPIPELDPTKAHSIEAIVDRVILKEGIRSRLLESLKLALKMGEGLVNCLYEKERQVMPDGTTRSLWKDLLFSAYYCCPKCKINYIELEPRTFSFNSPYGVCPVCHGLGKNEAFDLDRVVPNQHLSLDDGALAIWKGLSVSTFKRFQPAIASFLKRYKLDSQTALSNWNEKSRQKFFYGERNGDDATTAFLNGIAKSITTTTSGNESVPAFQSNNESSHHMTEYDRQLLNEIKGSKRQSLKSSNAAAASKGTKKSAAKNAVPPSYEPSDSQDSSEGIDTDGVFQGLLPILEELWNTTTSKKEKDFLSLFRGEVTCYACHGSRIRPESRTVTVEKKCIHEVTAMTTAQALNWFQTLELPAEQQAIAKPLLEQILERLDFMNRVGLEYMTLDRPTDSLSGGELQRVRLATGLGNGLTGVCYILDEPSMGLHPCDNQRLIDAMRRLQQRGNTVLVVEHDEAIMRQADWLIDMGPGAGHLGGTVLTQGTPRQVEEAAVSLTGKYLAGVESIPVPSKRRKISRTKQLVIEDVQTNNLHNVTASFPLGTFVCVTGVSGSGKSSLLNETLVPALARRLYSSLATPGPFKSLRGANRIDKLIQIDQSPIGRSPRSNPATYTGVFDEIRRVFANTKDAKRFGFKAGRFSFNVTGGRCEECQGQGIQKIEMHFLPDMYAVCPVCEGKRFNRQTLEIKYKDKSIADVLDMSVEEAIHFFENFPSISRFLVCLEKVGLGYLSLGQSSTTLSGGEAQRIKLATELARVDTGNTLYVLDEPTCGLHSNDIKKLLEVLNHLVDLGNTVIVIEHNLDVMKTADWIIDLGPDGGEQGGHIVATGTPEEIAALENNHTAQFLRTVLRPSS